MQHPFMSRRPRTSWASRLLVVPLLQLLLGGCQTTPASGRDTLPPAVL